MAQRIKGQEVELRIVVGGVIQETITAIRNFEVSFQFELQREGYLGETTDRRDEVNRGVRGRMEVHFEDRAILDMIQRILDRAARREPGLIININATLNFPNGTRVPIQIPNAFFGEAPMSFGSRTDYGTVGLEFEAADHRLLA